MTRTVSVIVFIIGMVLAGGFPFMPAAAAPGFGWGTAGPVETDDAGEAFNAEVAVDPQGNAVAVWRQRDDTRNTVRANRFVPGVGWGTAELIGTDAYHHAAPQVAVDPQGNAVVVWSDESINIWANRFVPGVGWGTAELIGTDTGFPPFPQVAVDPQGNAITVWSQFGGTGTGGFEFARSNIWANRFVPGVGWGTAELIETDAGDTFAFEPQVALDSQGNAIAVWDQDDGRRFSIWANRFVPGVGWGTAELIEIQGGDAGSPQVAVDPQGNAVAVWRQLNNIWANRFVPGVGWGTAELIETIAGAIQSPQVAVDPQGNAVAVWSESINIWANRFVPGVGWGTAELIESDTGFPGAPQVAVDPQGNAVAVWTQSTSIWSNRFVPGVGWGTAELIETDNAGTALFPQVAVDPQGNAVAVWTRSFDIWANRFVETEPGVLVPPEVVTFGVVGAVAAVAAVAALLLWRRRARGKEKA